MECNICGGSEFLPYNGRQNAMCKGCLSLERSRALYFLLTDRGLIFPGARVAHFAPEISLARSIKAVVGEENYEAYDLFPDIYGGDIGAKQFDLTADVKNLPDKRYDLILHAHVLEHLPCWISFVLFHLQRALTDRGRHLFCIPLVPGRSAMDFNPLDDETRIKQFYQKDHVRNFGIEDTKQNIGSLFKLDEENHNIKIEQYFADHHNIKTGEVSQTFFLFQRNDWALSL